MNDEPDVAPHEWANRYARTRARYELLATNLGVLLEALIEKEKIDVVQVENRCKTVDSFYGKLTRKGDRYGNPLEEVTDLAGVRVITYYLEDVDRVAELIRQEFDVCEEIDKRAELSADRFGYISKHFIVLPREDRRAMGEWERWAGLKAEIQVRTAAQHAWAAVEHKLEYKSPDLSSDYIKRRLSRLSALFELVDEQFAEIRQILSEEERQVVSNVREGNLEDPVEITSLKAYLDESDTVPDALAVAVRAGWRVKEEPDPADPDRQERDLQDLARSLKLLGMTQIKDFDEAVRRAGDAQNALEAVAAREAADPLGRGHANGEAFREDLLNIIVFLLCGAPPETVEDIYGGVTAESITEAVEAARRRPTIVATGGNGQSG